MSKKLEEKILEEIKRRVFDLEEKKSKHCCVVVCCR